MNDTSADTRYQYQTKLVKMYRWLRYKPYYTLKAILVMIKVVLLSIDKKKYSDFFRGGDWPKPTNKELCSHIWSIYMSESDMKMEHYWTTEELLEDIKKRMTVNN